MICYLAGFINNEVIDQCIEWRKKIRNHYHNYKGQVYPITFLDPINGEADYDVKLHNEGLQSRIPNKAIMLRDYISVVKKADIIVANMNTFGRTRPPIGTIMEVAWAWEHHKPVIVIAEEEMWEKHPMFACSTAILCKNVDELLENKWLQFFYKGWNAAIY